MIESFISISQIYVKLSQHFPPVSYTVLVVIHLAQELDSPLMGVKILHFEVQRAASCEELPAAMVLNLN